MPSVVKYPRMSANPVPIPAPAKTKPHMTTRNRILFLATAWLILLMPVWFWWYTWFGRPLSNQTLQEYLHDDHRPRHIQQALVQMGERMSHHDPAVAQWYPDAMRLATYPEEQVRNTDAWLMGQDTSVAGFHQTLLKMLSDPSLMVRGNAALSLVRFGDATGRPQIVALLQPAKILAPEAGKISDASSPGTSIRQGGIVATLAVSAGHILDLRAPISGRLGKLAANAGQPVGAGDLVAVIDPGTDQAWEALRGLYLVGQPEDIPAVQPYERDLPDISDQVRQQAVQTEQAIRERAK